MIRELKIMPVDDEMKVRFEAMKILNSFKELGFIKREAFIQTVNEYLPKYNIYPRFRTLEHFWVGRHYDSVLNSELEIVLEKLKAS